MERSGKDFNTGKGNISNTKKKNSTKTLTEDVVSKQLEHCMAIKILGQCLLMAVDMNLLLRPQILKAHTFRKIQDLLAQQSKIQAINAETTLIWRGSIARAVQCNCGSFTTHSRIAF